jgi:hypothetical protein
VDKGWQWRILENSFPILLHHAQTVPFRELVRVSEQPVEQAIYRKNLKPVIYVTGDVAGSAESPVYPILQMNKRLKELNAAHYGGQAGEVTVYNLNQPFTENQPAMKWDGEWHITLEVFHDLGLAFCVVMVLDLLTDGRLVQGLRHAAGGHGGYPLLADRHSAGSLGIERLFHRHLDDRFHGRGRDRGPQFDHPG